MTRQPADAAQGREQFQHAGVGRYLRRRDQVKRAILCGGGDHEKPQPDTGGQGGEKQRALPTAAQETDQGGQQVEQSREMGPRAVGNGPSSDALLEPGSRRVQTWGGISAIVTMIVSKAVRPITV